jgi:tRNA threonylcarbamoyladenosine biosynthesis protein TsaE
MVLTIHHLNDIATTASSFLKATSGHKHFAFYGSMGAGKTTFIKALCQRLGVIETVTSPTFAIVNEYHSKENDVVYHFDWYRINKVEELFDFGYENYLFSNHYCFIEWPEKAESVLPDHIMKVTITEEPDGSRKIDF